MRIAVISDTHDRLPGLLPGRLEAADEIWHLGDVCDPATLVELELLGKPLWIVAGNCDFHPAWPTHRRLERGSCTFHLEHVPLRRAPRGVNAVLNGHLHHPRDETDPLGVRWLSPGAITGPRGGSVAGFGWLTIPNGGGFNWAREAL